MTSGVSILKPLGYQRNRSCGYCKTQDGSCSYYLSCDNMRVDHYQELMDRGWRRSGSTYYKPDLPRQCCPHYTIRLKASHFKAKKEQRSALNKLNSYVTGPEYRQKAAKLCPQPREIKRQKRDKFILSDEAHKAEYDRLPRPVGKKSNQTIEPAHKFEVTLEGDSCTKEKHDVVLRYQTQIHNDPESRWTEGAFKRFLCSGLDRKVLKIKGKTLKLGSYHMCYRLDGKLVAVGVLDLLPHSVSSVYLFYDPEYQEWDWGKISALHEIALALEKGYQYYYMGYYIHSCPKMKYKGSFEPSYLLDPQALDWHPLDLELKAKLDSRKYVSPCADSISETKTSRDVDNPSAPEVDKKSNGAEALPGEESKEKSNEEDNLDIDSEPSEQEDMEIPDGSLFDYRIPGVLKKEEVVNLDLGKMKLLVRTSLIDLEDLRGWEEWAVDDPDTIKGITAELIAATGPKLLENTALALF